ncbi:isopentenyl-diphosphate Delta-isomerase [Rhodobacteraceae bacterium MCCB 386]|nr:isopentenyl-diphosphate Delta-isomerase [Roseitranquillus sediminis]MBM9593454.1 isopentenyl-diphosphate Delta-isomerase [Roseitranquillus sediminis]
MTLIPAWKDGALRPVEKLRVHREALRHKAVSVFVMDGDALLLQRRAADKYHTPGLWTNTCCTHPDWNEAAEACAARRLREELGITGLDLQHREQVEYRAEVGGGLVEHEVVDLFVAEARRPLPMSPDPAEVADARWVDLRDLEAEVELEPERFTPWLRIYLDTHREQIFGAAAPGGRARRPAQPDQEA